MILLSIIGLLNKEEAKVEEQKLCKGGKEEQKADSEQTIKVLSTLDIASS